MDNPVTFSNNLSHPASHHSVGYVQNYYHHLKKIGALFLFINTSESKTFPFQNDDMVIETQKPGLAIPSSTTFPVKTAKDPPICTSAAIVEIATKRTKMETADEFEISSDRLGKMGMR